MKKFGWIAVATFLFAAAAVAQTGPPSAVYGSVLDTVGLPGQFWSVTGNLEPVEKGNIFTENYIEQGATLFTMSRNTVSVTPYGALTFVYDSDQYNFNSKVDPTLGVRANKIFKNGLISFGTSYVYEDRYFGQAASGWSNYVSYWFGWNSIGETKNRFPGSSWGAVGSLSPVERGNYILQDYVTQGYVARRFGSAKTTALMPYAEITLGKDTKGYDWENKAVYGGGAKLGASHNEFYTEFGVGYLRENRFESGMSAGEIKAFLSFSYAWNLFGRKAR